MKAEIIRYNMEQKCVVCDNERHQYKCRQCSMKICITCITNIQVCPQCRDTPFGFLENDGVTVYLPDKTISEVKIFDDDLDFKSIFNIRTGMVSEHPTHKNDYKLLVRKFFETFEERGHLQCHCDYSNGPHSSAKQFVDYFKKNPPDFDRVEYGPFCILVHLKQTAAALHKLHSDECITNYGMMGGSFFINYIFEYTPFTQEFNISGCLQHDRNLNYTVKYCNVCHAILPKEGRYRTKRGHLETTQHKTALRDNPQVAWIRRLISDHFIEAFDKKMNGESIED